jgi:hypothetical protein
MKKLLAPVLAVAVFATLAYAGENYFHSVKAEFGAFATRLGVGVTEPSASYALDVVGASRFVGAVTMTGSPAITGNPAVTGNLSVSGQMLLPSVSSTTIASLVPAAVGAVVYNNTRASICIGTATTAGSWVFASTNGITTAGLTCKE